MAFRLNLPFFEEGLLVCIAGGFTSMVLDWQCNE